MIQYQSFGAAQQVTGSMHYFKFPNGFQLLFDCGLDYERDDFGVSASNLNFPFNPKEINAIILSHAHIDHSGNIPNLVRQGFEGNIYCTNATGYLLGDLWKDSLNIQQSENRKSGKKQKKGAEVLYSERHIQMAMQSLRTFDYNEFISLTDDIQFKYVQAGHIIGAASIYLEYKTVNKIIRIGFTGDLGNYNTQLVVNPQPMPSVDYLLSESTYGGRVHQDITDAQGMLSNYIDEICIKGRGKLVIPAFSIGRTQAIIFTLHQLHRAGKLPPTLKIYTDSPMAIKSTMVYDKFVKELNEETQAFYAKHHELFSFQNLKTVKEQAESDFISQSYEPCVIVSAAGMMEGGRIQKHIRHNVQWPENAILIAGYCSEGTLGAKLLSGSKTITINKKEKLVLAKIYKTDAFSAHADSVGLLDYYTKMDLNQSKKIFLVHGDLLGMNHLSKIIKEKFSKIEVVLPQKGQVFHLD